MLHTTHTFNVTTRDFALNFSGDVALTLKHVAGDQGTIVVRSASVNEQELVFEAQPHHIVLKDPVREKQSTAFGQAVFSRFDWKQSVGDVIKNAVKTIVTEAIQHGGKSHGTRLLEVEVSLPEVVQALTVYGTQIAFVNTGFAVEALTIKTNNLELESVKNPLCQRLKIDANNAEIKFLATDMIQSYEIEANCSKIKVHRMPSYQGRISMKGDAIKMKGQCEGDPAKGKIKIRCNAGKLIVKEPEAAPELTESI